MNYAHLNINEYLPGGDLILITLDTLRFDVAQELFKDNKLPNFSKWLSSSGWEKRYTPASFTFPAHHAFFAGFLPTKIDHQITPRLFAAKFQGSESTTNQTFVFEEANIVEALRNKGYKTVCIGGVGFFNKKNALSRVLPNMFEFSEWSEKTSVTEKESTKYQFELAIKYLQTNKPIFLFINISATHQPTRFYLSNKEKEDVETQKAALEYVDSQLPPLQQALGQRKTKQLIIICSDHGTAYGEDGIFGHRNGHETVMFVPYLEFFKGQ